MGFGDMPRVAIAGNHQHQSLQPVPETYCSRQARKLKNYKKSLQKRGNNVNWKIIQNKGCIGVGMHGVQVHTRYGGKGSLSSVR